MRAEKILYDIIILMHFLACHSFGPRRYHDTCFCPSYPRFPPPHRSHRRIGPELEPRDHLLHGRDEGAADAQVRRQPGPRGVGKRRVGFRGIGEIWVFARFIALNLIRMFESFNFGESPMLDGLVPSSINVSSVYRCIGFFSQSAVTESADLRR